MRKIADIFPLIDGLFSKMEYDFKFIDKSQLDILFLSSYGQKTSSPLVDLLLTSVPVDSSQLASLSDLVLKTNKNKWDKYLHIYEIEYEPIYNYYDELTEKITIENTETSDSTSEVADGGSVDKTLNNTKTNDLQENINISDEGTIDNESSNTRTNNLKDITVNSDVNKVYGFNSNSAVNSDEGTMNSDKTSTGTISDDGNSKETRNLEQNTEKSITGTVTDVSSTKETRNLVKDIVNSGSVNSDSEKNRTSVHKGNIGNITSQHLLKEEIELWKWNVVHEILNDVKDLLTIPMYIS